MARARVLYHVRLSSGLGEAPLTVSSRVPWRRLPSLAPLHHSTPGERHGPSRQLTMYVSLSVLSVRLSDSSRYLSGNLSTQTPFLTPPLRPQHSRFPKTAQRTTQNLHDRRRPIA